MSLFGPEDTDGPLGMPGDSAEGIHDDAVPDGTLTVTELHNRVTLALTESIGSVWITGEVREIKKWGQGWRFFDLVDTQPENGPGDPNPPKISVRLSNSTRQLVNRKIRSADSPLELRDGARLRIRGRLRSWAPRSEIQFEMSDIDVMYTRGVMAQERQRTLAAIAADGLLDANSHLPLPDPVLDLALITSTGSAAEADFLEELRLSHTGFRVKFLDARMQGNNAAATIVSALRTAGSLDVQAVVLVRGGGSALDLSAFDGEAIARAVAGCSLPVLTGIGHEIDNTVAGQVSHTDFKTPTACGSFLRERASHWEREVSTRLHQLQVSTRGSVSRRISGNAVRTRSVSSATRRHVHHEEVLMKGRIDRLHQTATQTLDRRSERLDPLGGRIRSTATAALGRWQERMSNREAVVAASSPARALALGWSITRNSDGELITNIEGVSTGQSVTTEVAGGSFSSVVEQTFPQSAPPDGAVQQ